MKKKFKIFIFLCLGGLAWSGIINGVCNYNQRMAWMFTVAPILLPAMLYLAFKKYRGH